MGFSSTTTELALPTAPPTSNGSVEVLFDVETTGFFIADQVMQIAALVGDNLFNRYILPSHKLSDEVSDLTGLKLSDDGEALLLHGDAVETTPRLQAWEDFVKYLQTFEKEIILVGHNINRCDLRFMLDETEDLGLYPHVSRLVVGYVETMKVLKEALPGLKSYAQTAIASELNIATDKAHDAVGDVKMLKEILHLSNVTDETVKKHQCTLDSYVKTREENRMKTLNRHMCEPSLQGLVGGVIKKNLIHNVASAGIDMEMLREAYAKDDEGGLRRLLCSQRDGNKKLVTRNQDKIINDIIAHLNNSN